MSLPHIAKKNGSSRSLHCRTRKDSQLKAIKRGDFAFATTTLVVVSKQGFENGVVEPCLICIYLYHRY